MLEKIYLFAYKNLCTFSEKIRISLDRFPDLGGESHPL